MKMFSYGMNCNLDGMERRCPDAVCLGAAELPDWKFSFKYHADVEPCANSSVAGVLWDISAADLDTMDQQEGYPDYYLRDTVMVLHQGSLVPAIVYFMTPGHELCFPSDSYWDMVLEGYQQNQVDVRQLYTAIAAI